MKKVFLWFVIILISLSGGYYIYLKYFKQTANVNSLSLIPRDAIYIIENHEPVNTWKRMSTAPIWQFLSQHPYFAGIASSARALDSTVASNEKLFSYFDQRSVYISAHKTHSGAYDFLYIIDLEGASKIDFLQTILDQVFKLSGWMKNSHDFRKYTVSDMLDKATGSVLHYTLIGNQMVLSYNGRLVEKAIETSEKPFWPSEQAFKQVSDRISGNGLFKLFVSGDMFDDWMACYQQPLDPMSIAISKLIHYAGTTLELSEDGFSVNGSINIHDSLDSYLKFMLLNGAGTKEAAAIIPDDAALYVGLGFGNFPNFFESLYRMQKASSSDLENYEEKLRFVEKWLGITLKEHFLSWIGSEAAYVMLAPHDSVAVNDYALVIKTNNMEDCQSKLNKVRKRIKRRTPFKVRRTDYHGHEIQSLAVKGLFELLFGSMFAKFEKPYYMMLGDYVVFTNEEASLYKFADHYDQGTTLDKLPGFQKVTNSLPQKSSLFTYMNLPRYLPLTKGKVSENTYRSFLKNRSYFEAFPYTAFQLIPNETYFELKLQTVFENPGSADTGISDLTDSVAAIAPDTLPENLVINMEGDDETGRDPEGRLVYKKAIGEDGLANGKYFEYWSDGTLRVKGFYTSGKKTGIWKFYDMNGKFLRKEEPETMEEPDAQ